MHSHAYLHTSTHTHARSNTRSYTRLRPTDLRRLRGALRDGQGQVQRRVDEGPLRDQGLADDAGAWSVL
jgi:hypothetical protein